MLYTPFYIAAGFAKLCNMNRPGLTDCGALGKIILGGPQIKVKTKKKKKKKGHSHFLQPFLTNQQYSYPNTAAK